MLCIFWCLLCFAAIASAFLMPRRSHRHGDRFIANLNHEARSILSRHTQSFHLKAGKLTDLPSGISPFESSREKAASRLDDRLRQIAQQAVQKAIADNSRSGGSLSKLEIEFPPLLLKGKTQFDDFDNVQELDLNRDWCAEFLTMLSTPEIWFLLPDTKECELAKDVWRGQRYRKAAKFTTIEAVTSYYTQGDYSKPWGATFASGIQGLMGGSGGSGGGGLLGDSNSLDSLDSGVPPALHLVCQPGNGGPVEDWINCEKLHEAAGGSTPTLIVNGALDKVRDGYYPGVFFPALAATVDRFYKKFESVLYLRPISDKGVYGWVFRVYPEDWQVVLQTVEKNTKGKDVTKNTVVYTSPDRPTFTLAINQLLQASR